jgi:hypothetical protein
VLRKYYAGARMYMIFDKVAKARLAEERRENDAMQVMLDQGDSVKDILGVMQSARLSEKSVLTLAGGLWVSFRRSAEQRH